MALCKYLKISNWIFLLVFIVATSTGQRENEIPISTSVLHNIATHHLPIMQRQMDAPSLVEMIMFGLAGIPVYKAVGMLLPFLMSKKSQTNQRDSGRVLKHYRSKRDLAYAQQLLNILLSVEESLEKYGVTEPQCQLKATCEIHKRNANAISSSSSQKNFIKLVSDMRREIQNPRVVPLAKYVFEYYEEAAMRGEEQGDCGDLYSKCEDSMEHIFRRIKGKKPRKLH
ncbi:uncharacterized protein CDAR_255041 [Caerostris darwini]|uniref:Uncharacterized protein n=1 Tax=Caerostris darwini TaxID=1538125 RepID=A0AAV4VBI3_9ARAC|nr:uncharacterized protein CDAR_255041 [Caerostris darwini]